MSSQRSPQFQTHSKKAKFTANKLCPRSSVLLTQKVGSVAVGNVSGSYLCLRSRCRNSRRVCILNKAFLSFAELESMTVWHRINPKVAETEDMCDCYLQDMTCYTCTADNAGGWGGGGGRSMPLAAPPIHTLFHEIFSRPDVPSHWLNSDTITRTTTLSFWSVLFSAGPTKSSACYCAARRPSWPPLCGTFHIQMIKPTII